MQLIAHRRNTLHELKKTPEYYGVEVDIRSFGNSLIVHHEPFTEGELFESWLSAYQHRTLILNVKEEGLENRIITLLKKFRIQDYFFLDQSFPFLVKYSLMGETRCSVRVSEFESIHTALKLAGRIDWAWIDCFTKFPLSYDDAHLLQSSGLKLCLVSPELQGRNAEKEIRALCQILSEEKIQPDAVCTKRPDLWEKFF